MKKNIPVAFARGDGIGPEIMDATLSILHAASAPLDLKQVEVGEKIYLKGFSSGIEPKTWETISSCKAFLKAPISTPQGGGFRSLNVTIRTALGLYANVRPCVAYSPYVKTLHPTMDVVIIRENEEDLYTGIEYGLGAHSYYALKVITEEGCARIIRYAFEYALQNERKKVTCFTKDNILKFSDGLFHKTFNLIAKEYPTIQSEHWIVDIGAAKLADNPEQFDVIVMPNLYGDILSDVAAQIAGSVGLAGSANIGTSGAMFEAIHGSAPRRANQNLANPSGLILASVMMLNYLELPEQASLIHNAWLKTLEDGIHTYDIYQADLSKNKVGTKEFAEAIIERLGKIPTTLKSVHYHSTSHKHHKPVESTALSETLVGCDLFIISRLSPTELAKKLENAPIPLKMIANRGAVVFPELNQANLSDTYRARFTSEQACNWDQLLDLQKFVCNQGLTLSGMFGLWKRNNILCYSLSPNEQ